MPPNSLTEAITNPQVAVPVTSAGAVASVLDAMPHLVSAGWLIYLMLLITHKIWQWYKEWRTGPRRWDET